MEELSQRTLGVLREILEGMQPDEVYDSSEITKFWRDALFDDGFPPAIIDIATSYNFQWTEIIPDLFVGKFGDKNSYFSDAVPKHLCEQTLRHLLAFALHLNKETPLAEELRQSLISDGFDLKPDSKVDSSVPAELAQIPGKTTLVADIQQKLDAKELISVLYIDLDGFKAVNDTLGHDEGDKCLVRIARIMAEAILGKGKLYRPGGDEFVIVLPNFTKEEAAVTAERIRAAVDTGNPGGTLKVTVSIGVAGSESGQDAGVVIAAADKAMYAAKKIKNRVVIG